MQQCVRVFVDQRHSEIRLIYLLFHLHDWLEVIQTSPFTDPLRFAVFLVVSVDNTNRHTELISCLLKGRNEIFSISGCFGLELGKWFTLRL